MKKQSNVLITGGSQRIGKQICEDLAKAGYNIIIHYNNSASEAKKLQKKIIKHNVKCKIIKCDLRKRKDLNGFLKKATKLLGPIHCLINNASIFKNDNAFSFNIELWNEHLSINLYAPLKLSQDFKKLIPEKSNGHIINILDQCVLNPETTFFSYSISKSAMYTATIILAKSFAPNIQVNAIGPGPTLKNKHQTLKHFKKQVKKTILKIGSPPDEISKSVIFILKSKAITGQFIAVDGGEHLS